MIRRHPHVFGDGDARNAGMVKDAWAAIKLQEKAEKRAAKAALGIEAPAEGLLSDVPGSMAELMQAVKLQEKAAKVGFDWNDPKAVIAKIREEVDEIEAEIDATAPADRIEDELGDVLFAVANLARHMKVDPGAALRRTNTKFRKRFAVIEATLRRMAAASMMPASMRWKRSGRPQRAGRSGGVVPAVPIPHGT